MLIIVRYEFEKYVASLEDVRHTLDDRLKQWSEYEGSFDRLLTWLSETETSLKDYVPRSTLEHKQEQLEKYQVRRARNQRNEPDKDDVIEADGTRYMSSLSCTADCMLDSSSILTVPFVCP